MSINACVLGYGLSAKTFQIPYILLTPGLALHSILQRTPTPANNAALDHPTAKVHTTFEDVLADPEIHLVIISTANSTHYSFAKALLEAGKHVVVEKPFAVTTAEADDLVAVGKRSGRVFTAFQNRRWDSDFLTLQRLLAANTFGTLISLDSHFDRFKPFGPPKDTWKSAQVPGNGILYDLGAHLVDQALTLFGLPTRVSASIRDERGASTDPTALPGTAGFADDAFTVLLHYDNPIPGIPTPTGGLLVTLCSSMTSLCERQVRYVVRGYTAGWVKHGLDPQEDQAKAGISVSDSAFGVEPSTSWGVLTTPEGSQATPAENGRYIDFFANLVDAINGVAPVAVKPEEAANVIRVLELLGRSEREGKVLAVPRV